MISKNQAELNAKRETLRELHGAIARIEHQLANDRAKVGVAVAETGEAPDDWAETVTRHGSDLEALKLGVARVTEEVRRFANACLLQVTRLTESRLKPAVLQLKQLKRDRADLLRSASALAANGEPTPEDFMAKLSTLEASIRRTQDEVDAVNAEIADKSVA